MIRQLFLILWIIKMVGNNNKEKKTRRTVLDTQNEKGTVIEAGRTKKRTHTRDRSGLECKYDDDDDNGGKYCQSFESPPARNPSLALALP